MTDRAPPDRMGHRDAGGPGGDAVASTQAAQSEALAGQHETRRLISNSYALLRSVIRWSAESAVSLESYALHMEGRVDAVGRILWAALREPGVPFDLGRLITEELQDQRACDGPHACSVHGPPVAVKPAAITVLTLLFHELVTNSVEHGALGMAEGGQLRVSWRIDEEEGGEPMLRLDWIERGAPAELRREGFGSVVLQEMLRYELDGSATRSFGPDGVRISVTLPMRNLAPPDAASTGD